MSDDMSGFGRKAQLEPDDFYTTPEGYIVFTEKYLLKRGYCCKSGCRHCPYGFNRNTGEVEGKQKPR
jgi:hypothetical protein